MERTEQLENKLVELVEQGSREDFVQWLHSTFTQALFVRLDLDQEELRDYWSLGHYTNDEQVKAQGQAEYIVGLIYDIKTIKEEPEEEESEND